MSPFCAVLVAILGVTLIVTLGLLVWWMFGFFDQEPKENN